MINFKSPIFWIFISGLVLFVVGSSLAFLAKWLGIISSIGWLMMGFSACWMWIKQYIAYKKEVQNARFVDAYIYAEEHDDAELIDKFGYDRKTERSLKWNSFNKFLTPLCGALFLITGIIMLVTTIQGL